MPALYVGHKIYPEDLAMLNPFSEFYYVDDTNGSDNYAGTSADEAFKTLGAAYTAATTNNDDVIFCRGISHIEEATMLTWAKNRIHVIGVGTAGASDMQPEIKLADNTVDAAATLKVTGFGNSFTNIYITNGGTHANSVAALHDIGENTVYTNCHFVKTSDEGETAVCNVMGQGDTTTWRNCRFGVNWHVMTAARTNFWIRRPSGQKMSNNHFEDCYFDVSSSDAGYTHIKIDNVNAIQMGNIWKNCIFHCTIWTGGGGVIITNSVTSVSGLADADLFFVNPACNSTNFCASVTDRVKVVAPAASNNALEGVTPA